MAEHVVERFCHRVLVELLNLNPFVTPVPSRATCPHWTEQDKQQMSLRVLSAFLHGVIFHLEKYDRNVRNDTIKDLDCLVGLPVAPKCTERAAKIANDISSDYELVVLQEIWHMRERHLIIFKAQESGFYCYHYFNLAVGFPFPMGVESFGTGLLVLSKFPISCALYHSFGLSGGPYALHESDFVGNKGVGLLRIETPSGQIDVYVTHLLVNYNIGGKPGIDAFTDASNDMDGLTFASPENKFSHGDHPMRMYYVMYKITKQPKNKSAWHLVKSSIFKGFFIDAQGEKRPCQTTLASVRSLHSVNLECIVASSWMVSML
ncbi:hypothetical protein KXD40_005014 [Peronospora effusa]|uniref:Endonuclease/exonuclease/phosphatase domain-containing protein n=1 Tax=Peronospora effusa TaxID=542832 RepID=A0A3M6VR42_9STRA|nr:hypothetical protein DD238_003230 [Peronospora effusa]RQM10992.1 hypothetical protein DD237_004264 [Peronospora effusa]UIZ22458.1 hypothetical protein KXD40_005014 [Peronospora effusa]CAI5707956.1 unnamed protein product [Peronospora effusa]